MIKFLDLHAQYLGIQAEIDAAIAQTIQNSSFIGGSSVRQFEEAFASFQQAQYCVGVGNGTDAIEIALEALGMPDGSEIIVPANSFIASSEAVTRAGHKVVFADVSPDTYTLDLDDVSRRIGLKTKAILVVHLYGQPCDMDAVKEFATKHDLKIIEDCAQAHGAEFRGHRVGAIGDIGTFSFYPGKNLGAYGDGGAILTNDEHLAKRARMIANHGRIGKYDHEFEGRNSRLDGLQAAILNVKLKHLDAWVNQRNKIAEHYLAGLADIKGLVLPIIQAQNRHAFHLFVVRTKQRDLLAQHLSGEGVATGIHYPTALPKLAAYSYLNQGNEKMVANTQDRQVLSLPIGDHLSLDDAAIVVRAVRRFFPSE